MIDKDQAATIRRNIEEADHQNILGTKINQGINSNILIQMYGI